MSARRWVAPLATVAGLVEGPAPAIAGPEYEADAAVSLGVNQVTQEASFQADPMAEPGDVASSSSTRVYTEIRPGLTLQTGSPRFQWRVNLQPSVNFDLGGGSPLYANQLNVSAITLPSKYTSLTLSAIAAQGGTSFILSQRPAETTQPEVRAQGNQNIVSATVSEAFTWDAGRFIRAQQSLVGNVSAPQDDLGEANSGLNGTLVLERPFKRFASGLEVRAGVSRLRPQRAEDPPYLSMTNAALVRFNYDFSWKWNGLATAGIEQVYTDSGSEPVALLPTGSFTALYTRGNTAAAVDLSHGAITNIQVGTVSISDRISGRGIFTLDQRKLRILSFSAGFLHNEPLGESDARVAAGTGNAIQGDVGFSTMLTKGILVTARYSIGYQFDQGGGLSPILSHIVLAGVTARYGTLAPGAELPKRGRRVDAADGKGLPAGGGAVEGTGGLGSPGAGNLPLGGIPDGSSSPGGAGGSTGGGAAPAGGAPPPPPPR